MFITTFIGRVGNEPKVISSEKGEFVSMDVVMNDYVNKEEKSTWVRVTSNSGAHVAMAKDGKIKKGFLLSLSGVLTAKIDEYEGKQRLEYSFRVDRFDYVPTGKKKDEN